jgi:predicted phosphoribosyltransferase
MFLTFSTRTVLFRDRADAGHRLAMALGQFDRGRDTIVLALPRGGVPIGYEISRHLALPLDVLNVRKLGMPGHEELAMGAIASGDVVHLDHDLIRESLIPEFQIQQAVMAARKEIQRRERLYRKGRAFPRLIGKTVILVDDGIATGSTMIAAITAVRQLGCSRVVVAVPVAPGSTCSELQTIADEVICLFQPEEFYGIGEWYEDFEQLGDDQVLMVLSAARQGDGQVRDPFGIN